MPECNHARSYTHVHTGCPSSGGSPSMPTVWRSWVFLCVRERPRAPFHGDLEVGILETAEHALQLPSTLVWVLGVEIREIWGRSMWQPSRKCGTLGMQGAQNVAFLARTCRKIRGLTHVSSAFVIGGSSPENPSPERLVAWRTPEGLPADAEELAWQFQTLKPARLQKRVPSLSTVFLTTKHVWYFNTSNDFLNWLI